MRSDCVSDSEISRVIFGSIIDTVSRAEEKVTTREVMFNSVVEDYYRCPRNSVKITVEGPLSKTPDFFHFGSELTCFGHLRARKSNDGSQDACEDVASEVRFQDGQVVLPFAPGEVVENLRLESYQPRFPAGYEELLRRIYYRLRPFTNAALRRRIQRFHARGWRNIKFPNWPLDTTVDRLCERLLLLSMQATGTEQIPFIWFWPNGAKASVVMTHDVESEAGRAFCADLIDMDEAHAVKSSFQIVPEGGYQISSAFLASIRRRGFEIGIQDLDHDGRLFDRKDQFLRRVQAINRYGREYGARGFRAAVLYRRPEWYDRLDFAFDMSMPNVAHLDPQRGGCCTVMPYFIGDILELPVTTTQDYTLFHLLEDCSIDLWTRQTELILARHGMVSFIIHPDYVIKAEFKAVYSALLRYLCLLRERENIWFALPSEVDRWWRARSKMSLVRVGTRYRIEGKGREDAMLAFATNLDGRLVYRFGEAQEVC